jgi:hypothetical protein
VSIPPGLQAAGATSRTITVTAGQSIIDQNFPLATLLSQTGTAFSDDNGNGIRDQNETGVGQVVVFIDLNNNGTLSLGEPQGLSGADGSFSVAFPGAGTYTVRAVVPSGFQLTAPTSGFHRITFTGTPLSNNFDFALRPSRNSGTLPASYGIASHGNVTGLTIGTSLENRGVQLRTPLVRGQQATIRVTTVNTTGAQACLHGWVDFDGNGSFEANEQIIENVIMGSESRDFTFTVPANAPNVLNMRFRYGYPANQPASGFVNSGEVEDYSFTVALTGDAVVDDRFSVLVNSTNNLLSVIANDNELPQAPMRIVQETLIPGLVRNTDNRSYSYTPPPGFRGTVSFTYVIANDVGTPYENLTLAQRTGTVTITVAFQASQPIAVDDSFDLPQNSSNVPLDVLANDISGNLGDVTVVSARGLGQGTVVVSSGGAAVRYSAPVGFSGTDQFEYTISDSAGNLSTAIGTVHLIPGDLLNDIVEFNLRALDTNGNLLPTGANGQVARVGQEFDLEVRVKDLRSLLGNIGVGSAFLDVLYSSQLVSPLLQTNGSLITSARNIFANFRTGTGLTPGIIDEIGGLQNNPPVGQPRNTTDDATLGLVLFRLRMRADATGTAEFIGDPADGALSETSLITPVGALGIQNLRFNRARLNIVPADGNFAFAKDDHFITPISNLVESSLNVLANDNPGPSGEIKIIRVTAADNGTVRIDDRGTSSPTDDRVIYSPNVGFNGTDQFTYTIQSLAGEVSTATVTVQVGNSSGDDLILFDLKAKALDGVTDITTVNVGETFKLVASVQDLRTSPVPGVLNDRRGVFAAFADVLFDQRLAQISTTQAAADLAANLNTSARVLGFDINYVNPYNSGIISGDVFFPGVINDVGAAQSSDGSGSPTGTALRTMFEVIVRAIAPGQLTFVADPANENPPFTDSLLFEPTQPVDIARIRYTASSVTVRAAGSEFTNPVNRFDVNSDTKVSPVDALLVINHLNITGPTSFGSGESPRRVSSYIDVNGDNKLTAADVLSVINQLNRQVRASEPSSISRDPSLASAEVDGIAYLPTMFAGTTSPFDAADDEEDEVLDLLAQDVASV